MKEVKSLDSKKISYATLLKEDDYQKMLGSRVDEYLDLPVNEKEPIEIETTDVSNFFKLNDVKSKDIFRNIQKANDNDLELLSNSINKGEIQTNSSNLNILKSTINDIIIKKNIINIWKGLVNRKNGDIKDNKTNSLLIDLTNRKQSNFKINNLLKDLSKRNKNNINSSELLSDIKNITLKETFFVGGQLSTSTFTIDDTIGVPGQYNIKIPFGTPLNYNNEIWTSNNFPENYGGSSYVMTICRNQGKCGCCWAFTLITACEIAWFLAGGEKQLLSAQSIIDCEYLHLNGLGSMVQTFGNPSTNYYDQESNRKLGFNCRN